MFGGGVYVAENTLREASVELPAFGGQPRRLSAVPVSIGRSRPGDFIV